MAGKKEDVLDAHWFAIGDDFGPVLVVRIGDGSADDAVVDAGVVGEEVEVVASLVAVVLVAFLAGQQQPRRRSRVIGLDHTLFGGGLTVGVDEDPVAAQRAVDADVVEVILLFVDQGIILAAEGVAVEPPPTVWRGFPAGGTGLR